MIESEKITVLSPSFSDGGAERVMSYLVNHSTVFTPICLQPRLDYLAEQNKALFPSHEVSHRKIINKIRNFIFLIKNIPKKSSIITCSYELFIIISVISMFFPKMKVFFRPSISFDYIEDEINRRFFFARSAIIFIFAMCCKRAGLIYQSDALALSFERFTTLKSTILQNPVSYDKNGIRPLNKVSNAPLRIVFAGRLTLEKGFDRFIDCVEFDPGSQSNVEWICYGTGPLQERAEDAAKAYPNFRFSGWTARSDFENVNSVLVIPSRIEGVPNIVLEAMLAGWPIVASPEVCDIFSFDPLISQWIYKFDFDNISNLIEVCSSALSKYSLDDHLYYASMIKSQRSIENYIDSILHFIGRN